MSRPWDSRWRHLPSLHLSRGPKSLNGLAVGIWLIGTLRPSRWHGGSSIACGINHGILDRDKFLPVAQKSWAGLANCLADDGKVQWGQLVGDRPAAVQEADTHEYVTGTFLLAASEIYKLAPRNNREE